MKVEGTDVRLVANLGRGLAGAVVDLDCPVVAGSIGMGRKSGRSRAGEQRQEDREQEAERPE